MTSKHSLYKFNLNQRGTIMKIVIRTISMKPNTKNRVLQVLKPVTRNRIIQAIN